MKRRPHALARRYARALYQVAAAEGPERARQLGRELADLVSLVLGHGELRATLANAAVAGEARGRVLGTIVEKTGGSALMGRLVALLSEHDRLGLLAAIAEAYDVERNGAEGVVAATAVTAVPLPAATREALAAALGARVGKRVELASEVEEAVLGGVLVRMGGHNYDGTVRSQLLALRRRLAAGS